MNSLHKQFHAVIFDFNGVLLWDEALQVKAWLETAIQLRGKPLSNDELALHMHGRTNSHTLSYLTDRELQGEELMELIQTKESRYRQLCLENPETFTLSPGAVSLLEFLVKNRIPRTIATASEKTNLDFFIEHLHLHKWFDIDQIVYDNGVRAGKPEPDIYVQASRNLGLLPSNCIVVEDAISGLRSANAAGIGLIIGLAPSSAQEELRKQKGVCEVIESLDGFPRHKLTRK